MSDEEIAALTSHNETIVCPQCETVQRAEVLHTSPWYSRVHVCTRCSYTIMESEWETYNYAPVPTLIVMPTPKGGY